MRWEELVKVGNLCSGAPLAAIVFCCGLEKRCDFRKRALELLGLTEADFKRVKERMKIEAEKTCYGNLAYCCSLNENCEARDNALKELGMPPAGYLRYKFRILEELVPKDKLEFAFREKVLYTFAFELVRIDNSNFEGYRGLAIGNPEITNTLMIVDFKPFEPNMSDFVKETVRKSEFISLRVTKEQYKQIADIAAEKGCSMSDIVRDAIALYLTLRSSKVAKLQVK